MELLIDVSGFTDDYANDIENALYAMSSNFDLSFPKDFFCIEQIMLEETIDDWEHVRALRLYNFCNDTKYYEVCRLLNILELNYQEQ